MSKVPSTNVTLRKVGIVSILLFLCVILFWVFACWAILDGGYFLTSLAFPDPLRWKPLVSDIVGKWSLSDESIRLVEASGTEMPFHEIEFHADGPFNSTNLPILHEWSDEKIDLLFYTGTGTWEFDKMRFKPWAIVLDYDYVEGLPTPPLYYFLRGKESPYKMDERPFVFEKKGKPPNNACSGRWVRAAFFEVFLASGFPVSLASPSSHSPQLTRAVGQFITRLEYHNNVHPSSILCARILVFQS